MRKKSFLATLLFALALSIATVMLAVTGCNTNNKPSTAAGVYYLSVLDGSTWTSYSSDSQVPTEKKFVKDGDNYKLSVELEQGDSVKIAQVGSDKTYGGNALFTTNTQLTAGSDNAISVGQSGTYALQFNAKDGEIDYTFTAKAEVVLVEIDNAAEFTITVGDNGKQLTATATLDNGNTIKTGITWESSDTSVATVSESGLVTAVAAGTATVKAKHGTVESDPVTVNVNGSVTLSKETLKLAVNGEETLTYTANGGAVAGEWSSTDESVATVDQTGKITALKAGTTTIRLSYIPRTGATPLFATCEVTVSVPVTGISLKNNLSVEKGKTDNLTVTVTPANADNKEYTFEVTEGSDKISVTKDGGTLTVTAVDTGSATIKVVSEEGNFEATCAVTVVAEGSVVANISDTSCTIRKTGTDVDKTKTLSVSVQGDTIESVVWTSDNPDVATVAATAENTAEATVTSTGATLKDGVMDKTGFGTATITAAITTANGTSFSKTCTVLVAPAHFYLYGDITVQINDQGGTGSWNSSVDVLGKYGNNMIFTDNGDGTYTLTRDLPAGGASSKNFRIGHDDGFTDDNTEKWGGINSRFLKSGAEIKNCSDGARNMYPEITGTYTFTIDLRGTQPVLDVKRIAIAVTGVELETTKGTLTSGNESENTATISLTINPGDATYATEDIVWECDNNTDVTLTVAEDKKTATLKVNDGVTENCKVYITCTVKGVANNPALEISVVKQGGTEVKPTGLSFNNGNPYFQNVNGNGGWSITLVPTFTSEDGSEVDNKNVTYSCEGLTFEGNTVTATKAGTYTITASAAADSSVTATITVTFYSDTFYAHVYEIDGWNAVSIPANYTFTDDGTHKIFTLKVALKETQKLALLYYQPGEAWDNALPKTAGTVESTVAAKDGNEIKISGADGIYIITVNISTTEIAISIVRESGEPEFTAKLAGGEQDVVSANGTLDKNRWTMELEDVDFAEDKVYTLQVLKGGEVAATITSVANFDGDAKNSFANGENGFTCSKAGSYNFTIVSDADGNVTVSVFEAKTYPYKLLINDSVVRGITLEPEDEGQSQYTLYFSKDMIEWVAVKFEVSSSLDANKSATAQWASDFTAQGGSIEYTNLSTDHVWLNGSISEGWNSVQSSNTGTMFGKIVFTVSESGDITIVSFTTADSLDELKPAEEA